MIPDPVSGQAHHTGAPTVRMETDVAHVDPPTSTQLAALQKIRTLSKSMLTMDSRDDILRTVASTFAAISALRLLGIYLVVLDGDRPVDHIAWSGPPSLISELNSLAGSDGGLNKPGEGWTWATSMLTLGMHLGYLVVTAQDEPEPADRFLATVLAQQTATALVVGERAGLVLVADEAPALTSARLEACVADLSRRTLAHEMMTDAAIHGHAADLARTAYSLTRLPVGIVDQFGHLQSSAEDPAAGDVWGDVRMPTSRDLSAAADAGRSIRVTDSLIAAARADSDVLGGVLLLDLDHSAGDFESYVVERTAALLTGELAHRLALAEMEMRLRGELVVELLEGLDEDEARTRAALFGHDLRQPHQVAVIRCAAGHDPEWIESALHGVGGSNDPSPMVGRRRGLVVAILAGGTDAGQLHKALKHARADFPCSVGMGESGVDPAGILLSYTQALRAVHVRERSPAPDGGTDFAELGLYQILEDPERGGAVDNFVRRWLGALIDYDAAKTAELVNTLAHFLDCGGSYDLTAQALLIHRSTLRYRLRRIRDLGGLDLADVDTRLNVHVATRAWRVLGVA
jgi:sugar diacid utilization regulator